MRLGPYARWRRHQEGCVIFFFQMVCIFRNDNATRHNRTENCTKQVAPSVRQIPHCIFHSRGSVVWCPRGAVDLRAGVRL